MAPLRHAHQVALGQVARARRCSCRRRHSSAAKPVPRPRLKPLPYALPTPLGPSPSLAKLAPAIKLFKSQSPQRTSYFNSITHCLPGSCFRAGEEVGDAWINLGPGEVPVDWKRQGSKLSKRGYRRVKRGRGGKH